MAIVTGRLCAVVAALVVAPEALAVNVILNGSFENNSATETIYNMNNASFNSIVADATAFGPGQEIDLITIGGFGFPPLNGNWKLALAGDTGDAFAFHLSEPIVAGQSYSLGLFAYADHSVPLRDRGPVEIGISNSATSFGTLVYSTPALATTNWEIFTSALAAPVGGSFLTVRVANRTWAHIDNFTLEVVPAPGSLPALAIGLGVCARRRRA